LGIEAELIRGGGGVFDVVADGDLVFSKYEVGRFPNKKEVLDKLRK
jgi:selT/selW/selH-like putative selenoprotein